MTGPLEIFYDGKCPLCRREMRFAKRVDRKARLSFVDFTQPGFAPIGVSESDLTRTIHARLDGQIFSGVEVFRQIYARFGLGWLMAVSRVRPIAWALELVYRHYARWRLRRRETCAVGVCVR